METRMISYSDGFVCPFCGKKLEETNGDGYTTSSPPDYRVIYVNYCSCRAARVERENFAGTIECWWEKLEEHQDEKNR